MCLRDNADLAGRGRWAVKGGSGTWVDVFGGELGRSADPAVGKSLRGVERRGTAAHDAPWVLLQDQTSDLVVGASRAGEVGPCIRPSKMYAIFVEPHAICGRGVHHAHIMP